jgi:hypothetical protein
MLSVPGAKTGAAIRSSATPSSILFDDKTDPSVRSRVVEC